MLKQLIRRVQTGRQIKSSSSIQPWFSTLWNPCFCPLMEALWRCCSCEWQSAETQCAWRAPTLEQRVLHDQYTASRKGKVSWKRGCKRKSQLCKECTHICKFNYKCNYSFWERGEGEKREREREKALLLYHPSNL